MSQARKNIEMWRTFARRARCHPAMMTPGQYRDRAKAAFGMGRQALGAEAREAFMSAGRDWTELAEFAEVQDRLLHDLVGRS